MTMGTLVATAVLYAWQGQVFKKIEHLSVLGFSKGIELIQCYIKGRFARSASMTSLE